MNSTNNMLMVTVYLVFARFKISHLKRVGRLVAMFLILYLLISYNFHGTRSKVNFSTKYQCDFIR